MMCLLYCLDSGEGTDQRFFHTKSQDKTEFVPTHGRVFTASSFTLWAYMGPPQHDISSGVHRGPHKACKALWGKGGATARTTDFLCEHKKSEQAKLAPTRFRLPKKIPAPKAPTRKKLVALWSRYARACKGIGETSVTFFGKGGAATRATDFLWKHKKSEQATLAPTWSG